jgi:hypothetical protein
MNTDRIERVPVVLCGPVEQRLMAGRRVYYAPGVPVLEPDAPTYDVPAQPRPGEPGAIEFARDISRWLVRLFDQPVEGITYRENPWDRRPCPRASQVEIAVAGHEIALVSYESRDSDLTQYAVSVDGRPVSFAFRRSMRNLPWRLAVTAWRATCAQRQDRCS